MSAITDYVRNEGDPQKRPDSNITNMDAGGDNNPVDGNMVHKVWEGFRGLPHEFVMILSLLAMFCLVMQWSPPKPKKDEDDTWWSWHTILGIPMGIGFGIVGALFLQWTKKTQANQSCTSVVLLAVIAALYAGVAWDSFMDNYKMYFIGGVVFFLLLLLSVTDKKNDKMRAGLALAFIAFIGGSGCANIYELVQLRDDDERNNTMATPIRVIYVFFLVFAALYYYYCLYNEIGESFGNGFEYGDTIMNSYEL